MSFNSSPSYSIVGYVEGKKDEKDTKKIYLVRICRDDEGNDDDNDDKNNRTRRWIEQGEDILVRQWPKGAPYRERLIHDHYDASIEHYGLPCSYLLILDDDKCIGHGRLTECFESAGGNAAAATFVVVGDMYRGHGYGSILMKLLEIETRRLGYHYMYLWTKTAIQFYQKIGYHECQRVSLKRSCLKILDTEQVHALESILMIKQQQKKKDDENVDENINSKRKSFTPKETILLPPDDDDETNENVPDVWLRKRLVEHVGSRYITIQERMVELEQAVSDCYDGDRSGSNGRNKLSWYYRLVSVPWQAQIGPSCGLAALRMVREYFHTVDTTDEHGTKNDDVKENQQQQQQQQQEQQQQQSSSLYDQMPSLLGEAQERGYTIDGEIFDANNLLKLAESVCDIDCSIISISKDIINQEQQNQQTTTVTTKLATERILKIMNEILAERNVMILPYDSNARTRLPCQVSGKSAHYGIIVGIIVGYDDIPSSATTDMNLPDEAIKLQSMNDESSSSSSFPSSMIVPQTILLLVQHSLSSKLAIAKLSDFISSNQQLTSIDTNKFTSEQILDLADRLIICKRKEK